MEISATSVIDEGAAADRSSRPVAGVRNVSKIFGPTVAVSQTTFDLYAGEIVALVGENGAGKSTCVKMLAGVHQPDIGSVTFDGADVSFGSPLDAQAHGIAIVHQHPSLFGDLSLAENVFAGNPLTNRFGLVDHQAMRARSLELLTMLGVEYDPSTPARQLRTSEQQLVEIAKAFAADARVLVLDEPTAALTAGEVDRLFAVVSRLRDNGVAIMFVGHRLEEIFAISDRITILRDGTFVTELRTADTTRNEVVEHMVGRHVDLDAKRAAYDPGELVLSVDSLGVDGEFREVTFQVHAGEVLGLGGLVGAGRTEVARTIFGINQPDSGTISLFGEQVEVTSPADAIARGIAYVSEDRRGQSIIDEFPILDNASLPMIGHTTRNGLVRRTEELDLVGDSLDRMKLRFHSYLQPISALSGGNQQKVVLAKWLASNPKLLILDEPTQGIDIQAKAEVHRIIDELAAAGIAIIVISSDMPELIATSDRVLVLKHGDVTAELEGDEITPINIGLAATGSTPGAQDGSRADTDDERSALRNGTVETDQGATPSHPQPDPTTVDPSPPASVVRRFVRQREFGLAAALAVIVVPLTLYNTNFYTGSNVRDLFIYASLVGIVGIGEMMVIITRNIDLSVASTLALAAYGAAATMRSSPDATIFLGIGVALAIGLAAGFVNGLLVAYGEVPSIVVTLGTLAVYRGILSEWSSGDRVTPGDVESGGWLAWTRHEPLGVPMIAIIGLAVFVTVGFALRRLRRGRETYCVGSNPEGAALVGIRVKRRVLGSFTACGVLAGLVGAMWASFYPFVDGQVAYGLELTVISGVVVGGVALRGGAGTVAGVAVGTLGLLAIRKSLTIAGVDDQYLLAIYGAAIIVAVSVDGVIKWLGDQRTAVSS